MLAWRYIHGRAPKALDCVRAAFVDGQTYVLSKNRTWRRIGLSVKKSSFTAGFKSIVHNPTLNYRSHLRHFCFVVAALGLITEPQKQDYIDFVERETSAEETEREIRAIEKRLKELRGDARIVA